MKRVIIEVQDDGLVTVTLESEGEEPSTEQYESVDEAIAALQAMLLPPEQDAEAAWNEELSSRPAQPGLMG